MTREEAIDELVLSHQIDAKLTDYKYDPAGSDYSYVPDPRGLELIEAVVGRRPEEKDLWFCMATQAERSCYQVRKDWLKKR